MYVSVNIGGNIRGQQKHASTALADGR